MKEAHRKKRRTLKSRLGFRFNIWEPIAVEEHTEAYMHVFFLIMSLMLYLQM